MAGYSKGIVATRKLNDKNKARLGRNGDTEIRKIDGEDNHVTAFEAYLIDVKGKVGEEYAKEVGAGTRNPITGLLERHGSFMNPFKTPMGHPAHHNTLLETVIDIGTAPVQGITGVDYGANVQAGLSEFGELVGDTGDILSEMVDYGEGFITSDPNTEAFGYDIDFSESGLAQQIEGVGDILAGNNNNKEEPNMWGEQKSYDELSAMSPEEMSNYLTTFGLEGTDQKYISKFETEPFDFLQKEKTTALEGLELQEGQLGATISRGMGTARAASRQAQSRSGFATQGTVTSALSDQMRNLTQDWGAGTQGIALDRGAARTAFDKAEYEEKKRQREGFYGDISTIKQFT